MRAGITPQESVFKWSRSELKESASAQSHFGDLCRLLDHGTRTELDPDGKWPTAEAAIWIGYIQWKCQNGHAFPEEPILKPIDSVFNMDSIPDYSEDGEPHKQCRFRARR